MVSNCFSIIAYHFFNTKKEVYMAKQKNTYVCIECGASHPKWQGQCSDCKEWNTLEEQVEVNSGHVAERGKVASKTSYSGVQSTGLKKLKDVDSVNYIRYQSDIVELDKILCGGIVKGSTQMISGEPGAGKSTLLLQYAASLSKHMPVLYSSGEESLEQISMRASRLKIDKDNDNLHMLAETNVNTIINLAMQCKAKILIVDSIQTCYIEDVSSSPGSPTQLRECTSALNRFCKTNDVSLWLVGHYTKDGSVAGPKQLEHIIDGVFVIEGESNSRFRVVRPKKYRFGNLETAFFAMTETGLKSVDNPSAIFLQRLPQDVSGSVVTVFWEGTRPVLVELQSLVEEATSNYPRRLTLGLEVNRVHMVLAIIQKHLGIHISDQDVFINIVGGLKANDTTPDLPIALATLSSFRNMSINRDVVCFGELGLSGEVRAVSNGVERIKEAEKLGFKYAIVPRGNIPKNYKGNIEMIPVDTLVDAHKMLDEKGLMSMIK